MDANDNDADDDDVDGDYDAAAEDDVVGDVVDFGRRFATNRQPMMTEI